MSNKKQAPPRREIKVNGRVYELQECGPVCGVVDGYLCPECHGYGKLVSNRKEEEEEAP